MLVGREKMGVNGQVKKILCQWQKELAFEEFLQRRDTNLCDRYWAQRAVVKHSVKVAKKMPD